VLGQQILAAVTRDHLGIAVAASDFVFAHPIPIAGRISAPDAQCNNYWLILTDEFSNGSTGLDPY
jgi:hypothetical protein